jgi:hypothetical protein
MRRLFVAPHESGVAPYQPIRHLSQSRLSGVDWKRLTLGQIDSDNPEKNRRAEPWKLTEAVTAARFATKQL